MKLQELLISSWYDEPNIHERVTDEDRHTLVTYKNHKRNTVSISLSYLLFSTPFLSLLEWDDNKCDKVWIHQYMKWWKFVEWYSIYEQYHKINLVLLTTDIERIKYIEEFTL